MSLPRARDFYKGQLLLGLEDTLDHMLWLGESLLVRNHLRTLDELIHKISTIKKGDVLRVARDLLVEQKFNLAIIGPLKEDQEKTLSALLGV